MELSQAITTPPHPNTVCLVRAHWVIVLLLTYLVAHGYTITSIDTIIHIHSSSSYQQFPLELAVCGMSLVEATYLHKLIDH